MSSALALNHPSLESALAQHQAGQLEAAADTYRRILAVLPDHADALHLLGVVAHQQGQHAEAVRLIGRAIELHPVEAAYFCNLGATRREMGQLDEATVALKQALALEPKLAEAHNNLGLLRLQQGDAPAARRCFLRALALNPHLIDAEINFANLLAGDGRMAEATERLERVLGLAPDLPKAHYNLANALREQGLFEAAIYHYRKALLGQPDYVEAHNNLGLAFAGQGDARAAVACFDRAIALEPRHAEAHNNLGLALLRDGDVDAAGRAFERAIELRPDLAQPHNNLAAVRARQGDREAAIASVRRALAIDPDCAEAHKRLGVLLQQQGRLQDAIAASRRAVECAADDPDATAQLLYQLQHACDFDRLPEVMDRVLAQTETALINGRRPGETPFGALTCSSDPARHLEIARAWAAGAEQRALQTGLRFDHDGRRGPRTRLRIGYLAAGFRDHPLAHQVRRVLQAHDRSRFEAMALAYGERGDGPERDGIRRAVDRFIDLGDCSDSEAARRIFREEIDILVDLAGQARPEGIGIPALRPAPVQVSWLGMPGTSGSGFIDYLIADPVVVPRSEFGHYSEQVVHLPGSCLPFGEDAPPTADCQRSDAGLPEARFVFASLNATWKIEPVMFDLWVDLLRTLPDSVLWLHRGNDAAVANLRTAAERRGVDGQRLVFADRVAHEENLRRLTLADLALDTRVCNGGLAIASALFAGVPVVSLIGTDYPSRIGASILAGLGLTDLLASSLDDYRRTALSLASDPGLFERVRLRLRDHRDRQPLSDPMRFARHLEDAYGSMWQRFEDGLPARSFAVPRREGA